MHGAHPRPGEIDELEGTAKALMKMHSAGYRLNLSQLQNPNSRHRTTARQAFFGTHEFEPSKLKVAFLPPVHTPGPDLPTSRRYTLTHSDITGQLRLSIGQDYNHAQLSGWYMRFIRDEVLAEWRQGLNERPELHVFCHVSGATPVPAGLRSTIFRREMPLVLRAIKYADEKYLAEGCLLGASVLLHLSSHVQALNLSIVLGVLGEESTWERPEKAWFEGSWLRLVHAAIARRRPQLTSSPGQALIERAAAAECESASTRMGSDACDAADSSTTEQRTSDGAVACSAAQPPEEMGALDVGVALSADVSEARQAQLRCLQLADELWQRQSMEELGVGQRRRSLNLPGRGLADIVK